MQEHALSILDVTCMNSGSFMTASFAGVGQWSDLAACDIAQWQPHPQYNKACEIYASRSCRGAGYGGGFVTEVNGNHARYGLSCFSE